VVKTSLEGGFSVEDGFVDVVPFADGIAFVACGAESFGDSYVGRAVVAADVVLAC